MRLSLWCASTVVRYQDSLVIKIADGVDCGGCLDQPGCMLYASVQPVSVISDPKMLCREQRAWCTTDCCVLISLHDS